MADKKFINWSIQTGSAKDNFCSTQSGVCWVYLQRWGRSGPECCTSWEEPLGLSASSSSTGGTTHCPFLGRVYAECVWCTVSSPPCSLGTSSGSWLLRFFFTLLIGSLHLDVCQIFLLLSPAPSVRSSPARRSLWVSREWHSSVEIVSISHYCCTVMQRSSTATVSMGDWASSVCGMLQSLPSSPLSSPSSLSHSFFPSSSLAPQISSFVWKVTKQPRLIMLR